MKPRRRPSPRVPKPDPVAANATWAAYCAALHARMVAGNAGQQAIADAECARIREWLAANDVDPEGLWDRGRFVLSGDRILSRSEWLREEQEAQEKARAVRGG